MPPTTTSLDLCSPAALVTRIPVGVGVGLGDDVDGLGIAKGIRGVGMIELGI